MTIYVDDLRMIAQVGSCRGRWSHLSSDKDTGELHEFADRLGLQRYWFQRGSQGWDWHYDVTDNKRRRAIQLGATAVGIREFAEIMAGASVEGRRETADMEVERESGQV